MKKTNIELAKGEKALVRHRRIELPTSNVEGQKKRRTSNVERPMVNRKEKMMDSIVFALLKEINSPSEAASIFDVRCWTFSVRSFLLSVFKVQIIFAKSYT
jgi:hypothetical protein